MSEANGKDDLKNPDHPQWVRRRKKLMAMFLVCSLGDTAIIAAATFNMVVGKPVDPNAVTLVWALTSGMAASAGIYVWQGLGRNT